MDAWGDGSDSSGRGRSSKQGGVTMMKNNYVQDVDQVHSSLAVYVWKQQCIETVAAFTAVVDTWLQALERPHEPGRYVVKMDFCRNWKTFLQQIGKRVTGIAGPSAPHVFHICPRNTLSPSHALRSQGSADDVLLRCKQFMSDMVWTSELTYCAKADLKKVCIPLAMDTRNPIDPDDKQKLMKYAEIIKNRPFNLADGSADLIAWLSGTRAMVPPVTLGWLMGAPAHSINRVANPQGSLQFEPDVCDVSVHKRRAVSTEECSIQGRFVNLVAAEMVRDHNASWRDALSTARRAWRLLPPVCYDLFGTAE